MVSELSLFCRPGLLELLWSFSSQPAATKKLKRPALLARLLDIHFQHCGWTMQQWCFVATIEARRFHSFGL